MKTFFCLCLFVLIFSPHVNAQKLSVEVNYVTEDPTNDKPVIYYSPSTKLTWNDFTGKPDLASNAAAMTAAGFGFKMAFHSNDNAATLTILVNCTFVKNNSWVKDGRKTPYILTHEQHHFDIAYIYTMQFIHDLKIAKYTVQDYSKVIEKIYYDSQTALLKMQNDYDGQTKNSQLADQQALWNQKIDAQIDALTKQ